MCAKVLDSMHSKLGVSDWKKGSFGKAHSSYVDCLDILDRDCRDSGDFLRVHTNPKGPKIETNQDLEIFKRD